MKHTRVSIAIGLLLLLNACSSTNTKQATSRCNIRPVHGFMDMKRFKKQCEAMPECRYIPEDKDYCPHDLACPFGGGRAPRCKSR